MSKFDVQIESNDTEGRLSLAGVIDEDVDFTNYDISKFTSLHLNLKDIKSINSCGIREWIKWMASSQASSIVFENCPKVIVDQINMVQGFLPSQAKVQSFFVPYFSEDSGEEKNVLFQYGTEFDDSGLKQEPEVKDASGNLMEMDIVEAKYFKFLKK